MRTKDAQTYETIPMTKNVNKSVRHHIMQQKDSFLVGIFDQNPFILSLVEAFLQHATIKTSSITAFQDHVR